MAQAQDEIIDTIRLGDRYSITIKQFSPEKGFIGDVYINTFEQNTGAPVKNIQLNQNIPLLQEHHARGRIYTHSIQKFGNKDGLFLYWHEGNSNDITHELIYMISDQNSIFSGTLQMVNDDKLIDFDKDGIPEILHTDHQFYVLETDDCGTFNSIFPNYSGRLSPSIYKLEENQFAQLQGKPYEACLDAYVDILEQELTKMSQVDFGVDILNYIHYFYVCAQVGNKQRALDFIKNHNQPFVYQCSSIKKGTLMEVKTTVYDFIKKYKEVILDSQ